jgi:hypothetical protein
VEPRAARFFGDFCEIDHRSLPDSGLLFRPVRKDQRTGVLTNKTHEEE